MWVKLLLLLLAKYADSNIIDDFISLLPHCVIAPEVCPNANVTFWLFTKGTQHNPYQLKVSDSKSLSSAPFVKNRPFKVLIHGQTGDLNFSPNKEIRPALFQHGDYNVISVDHKPLSLDLCYITTVINSKVVANCTAQLVDYLVQEANIPLSSFHIIGFSVGAQVAGLMSDYMKSGVLERITGLDPANPLYWNPNVTTNLDAGDAKFVDVIHTDGLKRGKLEHIGTVDFYLNGGVRQPGCNGSNIESESRCNHYRAPQYYAESINSKKGFYGVQCTSLFHYYFNLCNLKKNAVAIMGEFARPTSRGLYFVKTRSSPPFALGTGRVPII